MTPSCSLWTRRTNTTADSAAFYDWMSESHCKAACLTMSSCVAIYTTSAACFLHHNTDNLTATRPAAGVTQFVLNRHCLPSGVTATPTTTSSTTSNFSFGNTVWMNSTQTSVIVMHIVTWIPLLHSKPQTCDSRGRPQNFLGVGKFRGLRRPSPVGSINGAPMRSRRMFWK